MFESELSVAITNEAGWPTKSVENLCSLISRGTAPVYVEHSDVLAIGQRCVTTAEFAPDLARAHSQRAMRNVLQPKSGDVLLNSTGTGTIGRSVVFNSPGFFIVDGHVTVMRPIPELTDSRWLNSVLRTPAFQRHLERFCFAGSTNQLELSRTPLRVSRLPTPHINEQRAMGLIIDTINTAIRETEAIISKLKAVKQGLLHDLLTRGIDANGELRPPQAEAPHLYRESPLGWIPKSWGVGTIANYLDGEQQGIKPGPFGSSIKKETYSERGFKVYGQEQVIAGDQNIGDYFVPLRKYQELQDFAVEVGDVLISLVGTIGKVLVIKAPFIAGLINPRLMRLRPDLRIAEPEFTAFLISSDSFVRQVIANAGGGTMPVINKRIIASIHVPLVPLDEQQEMLKRKASVEQRIHLESAALGKLKTQKSGLMDDLLTGRVRVTPLLNTNNEQGAS